MPTGQSDGGILPLSFLHACCVPSWPPRFTGNTVLPETLYQVQGGTSHFSQTDLLEVSYNQATETEHLLLLWAVAELKGHRSDSTRPLRKDPIHGFMWTCSYSPLHLRVCAYAYGGNYQLLLLRWSTFYAGEVFPWALVSVEFFKTIWSMISFLLTISLCYFSLSSTVAEEGEKSLETKPKLGVNPHSSFQNAKWERKKWKHWLFPESCNNSSFSRLPCGLMRRSSRRQPSQQEQFVSLAACYRVPIYPSISITPSLVTFRICCKIQMFNLACNPPRTGYWSITEVHADILNWKWLVNEEVACGSIKRNDPLLDIEFSCGSLYF